jgi:hypothetical protein
MTTRSLLLAAAFALPLSAQDPRPAAATATGPAITAETEHLFLKAFYLHRGQRRSSEALPLFQKFLESAPNHAYSRDAATASIEILRAEGKIDEADKFREKYATLLRPGRPAAGEAEAAPPGERSDRPGRREGAPPAMTPEQQKQRIDELTKQIEAAKAAGDDEQVARLERQLERVKSGQGRGAGPGAGRQGRGGGIFGNTKITDMNDEQLEQFKNGLGMASRMTERMREGGNADQADKLEKSIEQLKKLLDEGKKEEAQKVLDDIRASMPRRGGGR